MNHVFIYVNEVTGDSKVIEAANSLLALSALMNEVEDITNWKILSSQG